MNLSDIKSKLVELLKSGLVPPAVLVHGAPGVGKTTSGLKIAEEVGIVPEIIQCSKWNSTIQEQLNNFCRTAPASCNLDHLLEENKNPIRMVILDEIDQFGTNQDQLRPIMDNYSEKVFFFATTNYPEKLTDAVQDRFLKSFIPSEGKSLRQIALEERLYAL